MRLASRGRTLDASAHWSRPVRTHGCSMFARMPRYGRAPIVIRSAARMGSSGQNGSSRHVLVSFDSSSRGRSEQSSGLLIRGFGRLRVLRGAPFGLRNIPISDHSLCPICSRADSRPRSGHETLAGLPGASAKILKPACDVVADGLSVIFLEIVPASAERDAAARLQPLGVPASTVGRYQRARFDARDRRVGVMQPSVATSMHVPILSGLGLTESIARAVAE